MEIVRFLLENTWVVGFCLVPLITVIGWLIWGKLDDKQIEKRDAYNEVLRGRGITAPAVVVSARHTVSRSPNGRKEMRIDYEVDVQPEGRVPFRQSFQHWTAQRNYATVLGQLVGEAGRKIWVTYDPNDPSQMIFEHYDEEHSKIIEQRDLDIRRREFNKQNEGSNELKKNGLQAEAVITRVDDLDLPYPLKQSRGMRLYFDVIPQNGEPFRSEGDALIAEIALEKYSAGTKVFVRYDPQNPERAVLDTERNKSLS
ncbi:MAG: hypothetical protein H6635_07105 [Anaerolineales bacterium]|nr:hypothetical protein [Anaerolineales bacterium]MCB9145120.1 hypothetical protein [Anaerolineales bacterium]